MKTVIIITLLFLTTLTPLFICCVKKRETVVNKDDRTLVNYFIESKVDRSSTNQYSKNIETKNLQTQCSNAAKIRFDSNTCLLQDVNWECSAEYAFSTLFDDLSGKFRDIFCFTEESFKNTNDIPSNEIEFKSRW